MSTPAYFSWPVNWAYQSEPKLRVRSVQFGDGYAQSGPDGLNNVQAVWTVEFESQDGLDETDEAEAFLEARGGWESFVWFAPRGQYIAVRCKQFRRSDRGLVEGLVQATFEQAFDAAHTAAVGMNQIVALAGSQNDAQSLLQALANTANRTY